MFNFEGFIKRILLRFEYMGSQSVKNDVVLPYYGCKVDVIMLKRVGEKLFYCSAFTTLVLHLYILFNIFTSVIQHCSE